VRIIYTREGKAIAQVVNATHVPAVGEFVFLRLGASDQGPRETLFKVVMVAWNTEVQQGDIGVPTFLQSEVYVLVEPASAP
jgi:hypothetical protein